MHVFWMVLIGMVVGALVGLLVSGRPGGITVSVILGACGAVLAGLLGGALGWFREPLSGAGMLASVLGAGLAVVVFGLLAHRRVHLS